VGNVLKVGVMLANEVGAKRWGYHNARGEIVILVNGETVAERKRCGVQGFEKIGLVVLGVFPVRHRRGQIRVKGIGEDLEEGSRAMQNLRVDVVEVVEGGDVTDDP
jgi:hypothetical protein